MRVCIGGGIGAIMAPAIRMIRCIRSDRDTTIGGGDTSGVVVCWHLTDATAGIFRPLYTCPSNPKLPK